MPRTNFTITAAAELIGSGNQDDINAKRSKIKALISNPSNRKIIVQVIKMCSPREDDDPDNLREFYRDLLTI
jgi:hypothetical protein